MRKKIAELNLTEKWLNIPNGTYLKQGILDNNSNQENLYVLDVYSNNLFAIRVDDSFKFVAVFLKANNNVYYADSNQFGKVSVFNPETFNKQKTPTADWFLRSALENDPESVVWYLNKNENELKQELKIGEFGYVNLMFSLNLI